MTLLDITNDVADEVDILRPSTIVGSVDPDARQLLRLANKAGRQIMKAFPWQALRKETTFTSVSGETQTGILPADFDRIVPETFWNRSTSKLLSGPVSPVEWQGLKTLNTTPTEPKFAYRGDAILTLPALSAGASLAFEYVSKNWCQSSGGAAQAKFAADTDTTIIDEELLTRAVVFEYLMAKGQPAAKAAADYQRYFNDLASNERASGGTVRVADIFGRGGRRFDGAPPVASTSTLLY